MPGVPRLWAESGDGYDGNAVGVFEPVTAGGDHHELARLAGHYLFSDFCRGQIWALPPGGGDVVEVAASGRSVSSSGTDAGGEVYVLTFWGAALRIVPP